MDDMPVDGAQPDQGQGADTSGQDTPYSEYLDRIPEEVRGQVEPVFKDWDANVTRRFQEAAEHRQQWEPYEQAGVNQLSPEEVSGLIQFRELLNDPEQFSQWYEQYAQQNGLQQQQFGDQPYVDPDLQAILDQRLEQAIGPVSQQLQQLTQWQQYQDQAAREAEAMRTVESQIEQLESTHGKDFSREGVEKFIANYIESDPEHAVQRAYDDYRQFVAAIEKQWTDSKLNAPQGAEAGGQADTAAEPLKGGPDLLKNAAMQALAQLQNRT